MKRAFNNNMIDDNDAKMKEKIEMQKQTAKQPQQTLFLMVQWLKCMINLAKMQKKCVC